MFQPEGEDDLKKRQLMELAIINGTYRDTTKPTTSAVGPTIVAASRKCCMIFPRRRVPCIVLLSRSYSCLLTE